MVEAYAGIDVAYAKRKRLPIIVCTHRDGKLEPLPLRSLPAPPVGKGNAQILDQPAVAGFAWPHDGQTLSDVLDRSVFSAPFIIDLLCICSPNGLHSPKNGPVCLDCERYFTALWQFNASLSCFPGSRSRS